MKAKDLLAIVDFIYLGEADIYREDPDGFLALAEELQLKGLDADKEVAGEEPIEKYFKIENMNGETFKKSIPKPTNNERYIPQSRKSTYELVSTDAEKLLVNAIMETRRDRPR